MTRAVRIIATAAANDGSAAGTVRTVQQSEQYRYPGYVLGCLTGTTAQRPLPTDPDMSNAGSNVNAGLLYYDTTLSLPLISDGQGNWRKLSDGSVA